MDFDRFQRDAKRTDNLQFENNRTRAEFCTLGAMAQLGTLAGRLQKKTRDGEDYTSLELDVAERIGHLLWYLSTIATSFQLSMATIAADNIAFNDRRWPVGHDEIGDLFPVSFDSSFPESERIPNALLAEFRVEQVSELEVVSVHLYDGPDPGGTSVPFGDPIDSNSWDNDDNYHFHDVYHFAFVAYLGWSPVVRKLLKRKRKSEPDTDRIEDGARARDTEEAITSFIYNYLKRQNLIHTSEHVDTTLLTSIRMLCRDLEVKKRFERDWEQAIVAGASAERELVENKGGWIVANRISRTVKFYPNESAVRAEM